MAARQVDPSEFDRALDTFLPPATLQLLIQLVREHYEAYGRWPTGEELHELIKQPGR